MRVVKRHFEREPAKINNYLIPALGLRTTVVLPLTQIKEYEGSPAV